eukprot:gene10543-18643_t
MAREGLRSRKGGEEQDGNASGAGGGKISMDMVKELAGKGRVTMVVEDIAYDFTDFVDLHPGGPSVILAKSAVERVRSMMSAGCDATNSSVATLPAFFFK